MAGLTPTGFEIKTLEEIEGEMDDALHSGISPTLNLTSTSAFGQLKGVTASHTSEVWDAALALYMSWDRESATGAALDRLGALTGARRKPATASSAVMELSLLAGTYAPGELVVSKVGDGTVRFSNPTEIVLASDDSSYQVTFLAEETGPIGANVGELVVIEPVDGFVSATNIAPAVPGEASESDTDYRRRQALELALKGSTTVDAIRADMLQVKDSNGVLIFDFVSVIENDTDNFVDGRPPHSFETLVIGGTDQEIAENLLLFKPAGIRAYGTTEVAVSDTQGNFHTIGFTRPVAEEVNIGITVDVIASKFQGADSVAEAVRDWFLANQSVGYDVIHARLVQVIMDLPGIIDCTVHIVGDANPIAGPETNYVVGAREIATLGNNVSQGDVDGIVVYAVGYVGGLP